MSAFEMPQDNRPSFTKEGPASTSASSSTVTMTIGGENHTLDYVPSQTVSDYARDAGGKLGGFFNRSSIMVNGTPASKSDTLSPGDRVTVTRRVSNG